MSSSSDSIILRRALQTALKLLYWTRLMYQYEEVLPAAWPCQSTAVKSDAPVLSAASRIAIAALEQYLQEVRTRVSVSGGTSGYHALLIPHVVW